MHCGRKLDFIEREMYYFPVTIVLLSLLSIHTVKHMHFDTLNYCTNSFSSEIQTNTQTYTRTHSVSSY